MPGRDHLRQPVPFNAFTVDRPELARRAAGAVDAPGRPGGRTRGRFTGVPMGVKDLSDCAGFPTSKGSRLFKDSPPATEDDVDVARLRAAGAVPVGKTAAPEFGTVCFTSTKAWGTTRNPWDPSVTPGGSSGGSAAAVAGGLVPMATASDGAARPASRAAFTGLVGLKPSYGRIPHPDNGLSQTTTFGILVTTVADCARHLDVTSGPDDRDRTSLPEPEVVRRAGGYERLAETLDIDGLRVGWSLDLVRGRRSRGGERRRGRGARALVAAAGAEWRPVGVHLTDPVRAWLGAGGARSLPEPRCGDVAGLRRRAGRDHRAMLSSSDAVGPPNWPGSASGACSSNKRSAPSTATSTSSSRPPPPSRPSPPRAPCPPRSPVRR